MQFIKKKTILSIKVSQHNTLEKPTIVCLLVNIWYVWCDFYVKLFPVTLLKGHFWTMCLFRRSQRFSVGQFEEYVSTSGPLLIRWNLFRADKKIVFRGDLKVFDLIENKRNVIYLKKIKHRETIARSYFYNYARKLYDRIIRYRNGVFFFENVFCALQLNAAESKTRRLAHYRKSGV